MTGPECNLALHVELASTLRLINGGHCDTAGCPKAAAACPLHGCAS